MKIKLFCLFLLLIIPSLALAEINPEEQFPVFRNKLWTLPSGIEFESPEIAYLNYPQNISQKAKIIFWVDFYSQMHKISFSRLLNLIECESQFDPKAKNPKDIDDRPKYGLLQFDSRTFTGKDIWSWQEQLEIGTRMMADGYWRRWPVCSNQNLAKK